MSTGGNVAYATSVDVVQIIGRVASAGTKAAPTNTTGKWTVSSTSAGVYSIVFSENYVQYLGTVIGVETATTYAVIVSYTAATRTLLINTFANGGVTATAVAFSFISSFSESLAP